MDKIGHRATIGAAMDKIGHRATIGAAMDKIGHRATIGAAMDKISGNATIGAAMDTIECRKLEHIAYSLPSLHPGLWSGTGVVVPSRCTG
jgi:hypothetical protein